MNTEMQETYRNRDLHPLGPICRITFAEIICMITFRRVNVIEVYSQYVDHVRDSENIFITHLAKAHSNRLGEARALPRIHL